MEKVGNSPQIINNKVFHIGQALFTKYGLKTLSAIQNIGNRKQSRCFHLDQANPLLYTSVVLNYTHHIPDKKRNAPLRTVQLSGKSQVIGQFSYYQCKGRSVTAASHVYCNQASKLC